MPPPSSSSRYHHTSFPLPRSINPEPSSHSSFRHSETHHRRPPSAPAWLLTSLSLATLAALGIHYIRKLVTEPPPADSETSATDQEKGLSQIEDTPSLAFTGSSRSSFSSSPITPSTTSKPQSSLAPMSPHQDNGFFQYENADWDPPPLWQEESFFAKNAGRYTHLPAGMARWDRIETLAEGGRRHTIIFA